jgi:hypothetical protein
MSTDKIDWSKKDAPISSADANNSIGALAMRPEMRCVLVMAVRSRSLY